MPVGSLFLFSIMKAVLRGGPVTTGLKSSQWLLEEPHSDDYSPELICKSVETRAVMNALLHRLLFTNNHWLLFQAGWTKNETCQSTEEQRDHFSKNL